MANKAFLWCLRSVFWSFTQGDDGEGTLITSALNPTWGKHGGYFCCSSEAELFLFGRMKVVFFSPTQTRNTLYHYPWGVYQQHPSPPPAQIDRVFCLFVVFFFFPLTQVPKDWVRCWSAHSKLLIPVYWSCPRRECGVQCHDKYQLRAPAIVPAALNRLVLLWGNVTCWVGMLVHACANALSKWVELN